MLASARMGRRVIELRTAHTADLDASTRSADGIRRTADKDGFIYVLPDICTG
jgi:hypothetical protein